MSKVSKTDWKRLETMKDEDIDTTDIAELGEDFFQRTELRAPAKQTVTIHLGVVQGTRSGLPDTHQSVIACVYGNKAAEI